MVVAWAHLVSRCEHARRSYHQRLVQRQKHVVGAHWECDELCGKLDYTPASGFCCIDEVARHGPFANQEQMPASYEPAEDATPVPPWSIATLSERDLSLKVPINLVTVPGVSLRQGCFGHNVFDSTAAVTCFSNLLATGFRRFEWDLFWDPSRRVWSFCPFQMPQSESGGVTNTTQVLFNSTTVTVTNAVISPRSLGRPTINEQIYKRQDSTAALTSDQSAAGKTATLDPSLAGTVTAQATTTSAPAPATATGELIQNGNYSCSPSMDFPILAAVLAKYFESTSNTLDAFLTYLTLNLHVAALSTSEPAESLNTTALPNPQEVVSVLLGVNLTSYLYTPSQLVHERADVNSSWFGSSSSAEPLAEFYNLTQNKDSASTDNGWPNEIYVEFEQQHRLLVEFGQIDPQMSAYDQSADAGVIFPSDYLRADVPDVTFGANGILESGCIYDQNDLTLAGNNNSWSSFSLTQFTATQRGFSDGPITEVANLTSCGISPFLNTTLFNTTADQDVSLYSDFIRSTTWAWQYGEPRNVSSNEDDSSRVRCAAMDRSLNGRWVVDDCTEKHFAACRVNGDPYTWRISSTRATYTSSNDICDDDQSFSVPYTALDNRHLFHQMLQEVQDDLIWMNFNSLDYGDCWVVGVNQTCPYRSRVTTDNSRKVVVPTVAAVIVFVIAALTIFVKCAANRQTSRRRRRRRLDSSWEYEGVPS